MTSLCDAAFSKLYDDAINKSANLNLSKPKQTVIRTPNRRLLKDVGMCNASAHEPKNHESERQSKYYDFLNNLVGRMSDSFDARTLGVLATVEEMLLSAAQGQLETDKIDKVVAFYGRDVKAEKLIQELHTFHSAISPTIDSSKLTFSDVVSATQKLVREVRALFLQFVA